MGKRGVVTIPKPIREAYHLDEGSHLTLLDLDGVLVLKPGPSEVDALAGRIGRELQARGESLEGMLEAVREERERYGGKA
jgi:AbrB family looped-hinge helix DNA binding protein